MQIKNWISKEEKETDYVKLPELDEYKGWFEELRRTGTPNPVTGEIYPKDEA